MDSIKTAGFEPFVHALVKKGRIPGLSVLLACRDTILFEQVYGWKTRGAKPEILEPGTIYDLASITKPLITAFLTVYLFSRGEMKLDQSVRDFFPTEPWDFTLRQLLTHTSGLPDWYPLYLYCPAGPIGLEAFRRIPAKAKPGRRVIYSCVGYMLLKSLLEKVTGIPWERLAQDIIFRPLGLKSCGFHFPAGQFQRIAPTEEGNDHERAMAERMDSRSAATFPWRSGTIRGETHDVNSFHQGGYGGNAGLFSDPRDLWKLASEFFPETATILEPSHVELFWANATSSSRAHRTIGFKLNSSLMTSAGRALERDAIGHNGFTGTSLWLEKGSGRVWILLSNRIHPRVLAAPFDPIRRKLHWLLQREQIGS